MVTNHVHVGCFPPTEPPSPSAPPPVTYYAYQYVTLYSGRSIIPKFQSNGRPPLTNLSVLVENLLSGISRQDVWGPGTWGIPKDQVTVTRVAVNGMEVPPPTSGSLDWDYVRQYPYSGGNVFLYFSVTVDSSKQEPDVEELAWKSNSDRVKLYNGGTRACMLQLQ